MADFDKQPEASYEVAQAEAAQVVQPVTAQVTSATPATKPTNPRQVEAGRKTAEKTRLACEQQKKAAAEATIIIANNQAKGPPPAPAPAQQETPQGDISGVLTTTQWLSVISIIVSLAGIYYKREEIKNRFFSTPLPPKAPPPSLAGTHRSPLPRKGIRSMD